MTFDLDQLARRMTDAAKRAGGMQVTVSTFDLIISKDGHGTNRCESVPFAALFLSDKDVLGEALDRLERGGASAPTATSA
jgi:hypothetical protein